MKLILCLVVFVFVPALGSSNKKEARVIKLLELLERQVGNRSTLDSYVESEELKDYPVCLLPPDSGSCKTVVTRYYFDPAFGKCLPFNYGGCYGNVNNFKSLHFCEWFCKDYSRQISASTNNITMSAIQRAQKPSQCPPIPLGVVKAACTNSCRTDWDCQTGYLCCNNGCASECMEAVSAFKQSHLCPQKVKVGSCVDRCTEDFDCEKLPEKATGMLCCFNGCGMACVDPEIKVPSTAKPVKYEIVYPKPTSFHRTKNIHKNPVQTPPGMFNSDRLKEPSVPGYHRPVFENSSPYYTKLPIYTVKRKVSDGHMYNREPHNSEFDESSHQDVTPESSQHQKHVFPINQVDDGLHDVVSDSSDTHKVVRPTRYQNFDDYITSDVLPTRHQSTNNNEDRPFRQIPDNPHDVVSDSSDSHKVVRPTRYQNLDDYVTSDVLPTRHQSTNNNEDSPFRQIPDNPHDVVSDSSDSHKVVRPTRYQNLDDYVTSDVLPTRHQSTNNNEENPFRQIPDNPPRQIPDTTLRQIPDNQALRPTRYHHITQPTRYQTSIPFNSNKVAQLTKFTSSVSVPTRDKFVHSNFHGSISDIRDVSSDIDKNRGVRGDTDHDTYGDFDLSEMENDYMGDAMSAIQLLRNIMQPDRSGFQPTDRSSKLIYIEPSDAFSLERNPKEGIFLFDTICDENGDGSKMSKCNADSSINGTDRYGNIADFSGEFCLIPPVTGPVRCDALIPRWTYNATEGKCQEFIYGGCGGTRNLFISRAECQESCNQCVLPLDGGRCNEDIPRSRFRSSKDVSDSSTQVVEGI